MPKTGTQGFTEGRSKKASGFSALSPDDRNVLLGFAGIVARLDDTHELYAVFLAALEQQCPDLPEPVTEFERLLQGVRQYHTSREHHGLMAPNIIRLVEIGNKSDEVRKLVPGRLWPWPDTIRRLKKACPEQTP